MSGGPPRILLQETINDLHIPRGLEALKMGPSQSLILSCVLCIFFTLASSSDFTSLVFKGCADQNFQDFNGIYEQTLKTLLDALMSQSSSTKFYKTSSGDGSSAIDGLFQCRGDLSNDDCNSCVKNTPAMAQKLCGQAVAVRVQLNGCYLRYEISGFRQASGSEVLYKVCGSNRASWAGFGDSLDVALGEVVKGVGSGNSGFYAGEYQSVFVLGQCEGDLGSEDCVTCVKNAIEKVKSVCVGSISAQIYLQECYISYAYYPSGVPSNQKPLSSSGRTEGSTQKKVAIVLGGLVGMGLMTACLLFTRSVFKKKTHPHRFGG